MPVGQVLRFSRSVRPSVFDTKRRPWIVDHRSARALTTGLARARECLDRGDADDVRSALIEPSLAAAARPFPPSAFSIWLQPGESEPLLASPPRIAPALTPTPVGVPIDLATRTRSRTDSEAAHLEAGCLDDTSKLSAGSDWA
jgi:hypothetical protein